MRRPHVYERSAPRGQRPAYQEPAPDPIREIGDALSGLIRKAEAAGLPPLVDALRAARDEADRQAGQGRDGSEAE